MARTRINGKEVDHERNTYKIRKRSSRLQRKDKDGTLLKSLKLELRNRTTKQTRRWINHVIESPKRGGMSLDIEQELRAHTHKPDEKQKKTRLSLEPELSRKAAEFWRALQDQRRAAIAAQGQPFEAVDWWVRKSGGGGNGEEARKDKMSKAIQSLSARMKELGVKGEDGQMDELGVDVEEEKEEGSEFKEMGPPEPAPADQAEHDEDEGGVPLAGSHLPSMLSPVVSPALKEEDLPVLTFVLPLR